MGRPSICVSAVHAGRSATIGSPCESPLSAHPPTSALTPTPTSSSTSTPTSLSLSLRLLIVRHAETATCSIKPRVLQGQSDAPLTDTGLKQASSLATRLAREPIEFIYSSDLKRAKETAELIAARHGVPVYLDKRLREQHLGDLAGRAWADVKASLKRAKTSFEDHLLKLSTEAASPRPRAETQAMLKARAQDVYVDIVERHLLAPHGIALGRKPESNGLPPETQARAAPRAGDRRHHVVLLVTHGGPIQQLMRHLVSDLGFRAPEVMLSRFPKIASLYEVQLDFRMSKWTGTLARFNCVSHMAGLRNLVYDKTTRRLVKRTARRNSSVPAGAAAAASDSLSNNPTTTSTKSSSFLGGFFGARGGSSSESQAKTSAGASAPAPAPAPSPPKKSLGW